MPKKSLSQKILEALELSKQLNKALNTLSPEIREIILKQIQARPRRRRRRARAARKMKRNVKEAASA
ncbi:MAG: hypothetical protein QXJ73_07720 [Candidatus Caldarchaeum sp.]